MSRQYRGTRVFLNVYDLVEGNDWAYQWGFGAYHSGVQIGSIEYSFGGHESAHTGCYECDPKTVPLKFREQIDMGETTLNSREVQGIIESLKSKFPGNSYNLMSNNCNHYSNTLCQALLKKEIPGWVNRAAWWGKMTECLIPKNPNAEDTQEMIPKNGLTPFSGSGMTLGNSTAKTSNTTTPNSTASAKPELIDRNLQREQLLQAAMKRNAYNSQE